MNAEIDQVLETCIEKMSKKNKLQASKLAPRRESTLAMVKGKIDKFKQKTKPKQTKPIFCDPDFISYVEALQNALLL